LSLINKMLQDLESRKNPAADAANTKPVFEDLKPVRGSHYQAPSRGRLKLLLAFIVIVGAGAYSWMQWGDQLLAGLYPGKPEVAKPAVASIKPLPKTAPAPQPVPQTPVATVAPTTNVNPAPALPKVEPPVVNEQVAKVNKDATVEAETKATVTSPAPITEKSSVAPEKARAEAVSDSSYWTVSRGETLYGISRKTGIDLGDLSAWNQLGSDRMIRPGQRLRLTPPGSADMKPAAQTAKVAPQGKTPEKRQAPVAAAKKAMPRTRDAVSKTAPVTTPAFGERTIAKGEMEKKSKPFSPDDKAEMEYHRAANLLQQGRAADAERQLRASLAISPEHTKARELLAGLLLQRGRWRDAQQLLETGIEKVPAYFPFAQLLARVHAEHGADRKALDVMEGSRQAGAESADYMGFLAALHQRVGHHSEAINAYTQAIKLNPQEGRSWLGMAISLEAIHAGNAAGEAYQRAIDTGTLDDNLQKYVQQRLAAIRKK